MALAAIAAVIPLAILHDVPSLMQAMHQAYTGQPTLDTIA